MIHPQYVVALADTHILQFKILKKYKKYNFEINIYLNDVQILYKIKERFKVGKILNIDNNYFMTIRNNFEQIIQFFQKNRIMNKQQHLTFKRWCYLYNKLQQDKFSEKENKKIIRRLTYFGVI